jgi:hypothetical protein
MARSNLKQRTYRPRVAGWRAGSTAIPPGPRSSHPPWRLPRTCRQGRRPARPVAPDAADACNPAGLRLDALAAVPGADPTGSEAVFSCSASRPRPAVAIRTTAADVRAGQAHSDTTAWPMIRAPGRSRSPPADCLRAVDRRAIGLKLVRSSPSRRPSRPEGRRPKAHPAVRPGGSGATEGPTSARRSTLRSHPRATISNARNWARRRPPGPDHLP